MVHASLLHCGLLFQTHVDIFFVDWERPHGKVSSTADSQKGGTEAPVSIWRTYFVANEWNEIQTIRKTSPFFQLFCTLFFLNVLGFENVTTADPSSDFTRDSDKYYAPDSRIFRFAIAASVYILVGEFAEQLGSSDIISFVCAQSTEVVTFAFCIRLSDEQFIFSCFPMDIPHIHIRAVR